MTHAATPNDAVFSGDGGVPPTDRPTRAEARTQLTASLVRTVLDEPRTRHLAGGDGASSGVLVPDRDAVVALLDDLRDLMFPGFFKRRDLTPDRLPLVVSELLASIELRVETQVRSVLRYARDFTRSTDRGDCGESRVSVEPGD